MTAVASSSAPRFEYLGVPLNRDDDVFPVAQGMTYRALVSVSKDYDKATVADALSARGWKEVTLWEPGESLPADWPREDVSSGLEDGHRWLRGEATRMGPSDAIDRVSTVHAIVTLHLSAYRIAQLWKRVPALDQGLIIGPGPGPHGLDAGIPPAIATAVLEAWTNETDPGRLSALGATMRQAGLVVAANVLDQRALVLEAGGLRSSVEQARLRDRAGGAMFFASILGMLAALLRR
jgi:hypothetical protein